MDQPSAASVSTRREKSDPTLISLRCARRGRHHLVPTRNIAVRADMEHHHVRTRQRHQYKLCEELARIEPNMTAPAKAYQVQGISSTFQLRRPLLRYVALRQVRALLNATAACQCRLRCRPP